MAEISCKVEKITPEMAKNYLKHNCVNNRNISPTRVNNYAEVMRNGAWQLNGEPIQFDASGTLLNGQHRLSAIIKADIPIDIWVVRGIDSNVDLYDRGNIRSTYQSLRMSGLDGSIANNATCSAAKLYIQLKEQTNKFVSDFRIREFLLDNENNIVKAYHICNRYRADNPGRISAANACFIVAVFNALEAGESEENMTRFIDIVCTGLYDGKHESAAIICRNDVMGGYISSTNNKENRAYSVMRIEKALYDFCHRTPRKLSYRNIDKYTYLKLA